MQDFSKRLRALRDEKGEAQSDIAKLLGVTKATVSKYETGQSEPDMHSIKKLADYFGVTIDYIFGRADMRTGNIEGSGSQDMLGRIMEDESFIRLAVKIKENGLEIREVNKLLDSILRIKENHKEPL